jgi:hypothetical protein
MVEEGALDDYNDVSLNKNSPQKIFVCRMVNGNDVVGVKVCKSSWHSLDSRDIMVGTIPYTETYR